MPNGGMTITGLEDLTRFTRLIEGLPSAIERVGVSSVNQISNYFAFRARNLAPKLTGKLRELLQPTQTFVFGNRIIGGVEDTTEYALIQHEWPVETWHPGPVSAQQPAMEEGPVGPKYMERVRNHRPNIEVFLSILRRNFSQVLSGATFYVDTSNLE